MAAVISSVVSSLFTEMRILKIQRFPFQYYCSQVNYILSINLLWFIYSESCERHFGHKNSTICHNMFIFNEYQIKFCKFKLRAKHSFPRAKQTFPHNQTQLSIQPNTAFHTNKDSFSHNQTQLSTQPKFSIQPNSFPYNQTVFNTTKHSFPHNQTQFSIQPNIAFHTIIHSFPHNQTQLSTQPNSQAASHNKTQLSTQPNIAFKKVKHRFLLKHSFTIGSTRRLLQCTLQGVYVIHVLTPFCTNIIRSHAYLAGGR